MDRPFRVPLGGFRIRGLWFGVTPCLGIVLCSAMAGPLVFDVIHKIGAGNPVPALLLGGHALVGLAIYTFYGRSEEHTSELQSLMRISYAVFCLTKKKDTINPYD